jgi:myo-inositol-1(or 4)-monophosphatase
MRDTRERAAVCERAARAGGAVARDTFRGSLSVSTKADKNDLVTEADHDSQRQIVHTIDQADPDARFVCEETPAEIADERFLDSVPESGTCWVVDPIDGTANYARGLRLWASAVAAVEDGEAVGAATYLPAVQDCYTVGPDGASRDGTTLSTSDREDPETFATAITGRWSVDSADRLGALATSVTETLGDFRRYGSLQSTLSFVASGELDAVVTTEPTAPWDTLAGVGMVRAAGGTVTGVDGERWTLDSEGLVASNGNAHEAVLAAVPTPAPEA